MIALYIALGVVVYGAGLGAGAGFARLLGVKNSSADIVGDVTWAAVLWPFFLPAAVTYHLATRPKRKALPTARVVETPNGSVIRDGAHVMVGTPRPLAKNFKSSYVPRDENE